MAKKSLFDKYKEILKSGKISENEIISMKSWMNRTANGDERREIFNLMENKGNYISLSNGQQTKGFDFLKKQMKTSTGKISKNNPFGYREMYVLEDGEDIKLKDFYDAGRGFNKFYIPVYIVQSKGGQTFEYYYDGKVNIIG